MNLVSPDMLCNIPSTACEPRLLSGRRTVEGVLIGWLYREVHFCFPKYDAGLGVQPGKKRNVDCDLYLYDPLVF